MVRGLVCRDEPEDYRPIFRVYSIDGVYPWPAPPSPMPREIFILGECVPPSAPARWCARRSGTSCITSFPGRLSIAGNVVHPAGIVRRHGVPLQRLSHHASRRAGAAVPGRDRGSVICPGQPRLLTPRLPHRRASPERSNGLSRKMLSPPGDREGSNPSPSGSQSVSPVPSMPTAGKTRLVPGV